MYVTVNIWTDPTKTFGPLGGISGITLILLDCPPRSADRTRADLIRNWRLLRAFAEASATPVKRLRNPCEPDAFAEILHQGDHGPSDHFVIAGKAGDNAMLPILLQAALQGIRISIIHDAFLDGRARRSGAMPIVSRRPMGNAPLYISTSQALAGMLMQHGVDDCIR